MSSAPSPPSSSPDRHAATRSVRASFESWKSLPIVVFLIGFGLGAWVFFWLQAEAGRADRTRFDALIQGIEYDVDKQMAGYIHALNGGVAFYDAVPQVPRATWRTFAATLDLPNRYPGIWGIGVIYHVPPEEKSSFLQRVRADHRPDFVIKNTAGENTSDLPSPQPSYVITYVEPEAQNRPAVGLDVASEANRREAAERACDSASPVMTRRIALVQDGRQRPGFLLYVPFYQDGRVPPTVMERRQHLRGWIYAPFVTEEFVHQVLHLEQLAEVGLSIFDGDTMQPDNRIFSSLRLSSTPSDYERVTTLRLAGQTFTVGWHRQPGFRAADRFAAVWAGGFSLGVALLLAALVANLQAIGRQAKQLLELQGAELAQQKFALDQHAIVAITDVAGTITYANDRFCQISGYSRAELIGSNHRMLKSGMHPREYYEGLYRTIGSGKVWRGEFCNRRKDGGLYWVDATIVPFLDPSGRVSRYVAIRTDITARKEAEKGLRESQDRLASIFGEVNEGILLLDARLQPIEFNQAAERLLGLTREQILSRRPPEGWTLRREDGAGLRLDSDSGSPFDPDLPMRGQVVSVQTHAGAVRWLSINRKPLRNSAGELQSVVCSLSDVTERRQAEKALTEAAQRLRLAAEAADLGVWDWDLARNEVLWDARMFAIHGMPPTPDGRIQYADWAARVLPEDLPSQEKALRETVEQCGQGQRSFRIRRHSDGSLRHLQAQELVLTDNSGKALRVIGINRDVTTLVAEAAKRRELEASLEKARDDALAASRLKSEFLATMSHEIRTPMNGIIGMANLLLQTRLEKKQQDMAQVLVHSADSLLTIINDILDFSKIEAGKLRIDPADFNLQGAIEETSALLAPAARRKGLQFVIDTDPALATGLHGDSGRIQQVLTNLLGNALKFTERGEIRVTSRVVRENAQELQFRIAVSDTGVGIPAEARPRLFQPFVQGDASTTRRFGGTGLGLAICRQLVSLMQGRMGFESSEGAGSSFWFELTLPRAANSVLASAPRGRPRAARPSSGDLPVAAPAVPRPGAGLRLLVAEDNETNQIVAQYLIEQLGHSLVVARNGQEALDLLARERFDAVLMDCQMPVLDGYQAAARIRHREVPGVDPEIPIIALTAYALPADRARVLEAGMDDYVSKPLSSETLQAALVRCGLVPQADPSSPAAAAPPPAPASVDFDPSQREKLRQIPTPDGVSLWDRALGVFLAEMPGRMTALAGHASAGRLDELATLSHTIAGSCASIGGPALRSASLALESAAKARDTSRFPELLAAVVQAWQNLQQKLRDAHAP